MESQDSHMNEFRAAEDVAYLMLAELLRVALETKAYDSFSSKNLLLAAWKYASTTSSLRYAAGFGLADWRESGKVAIDQINHDVEMWFNTGSLMPPRASA